MRGNASVVLAAIVTSLALCRAGRADLQGMEVSSLEWLVDSSDAIAVGEVASTWENPLDRQISYVDVYRITQVVKHHKQLRVGQTLRGRSRDGAKGDNVMLFLREKAGGLSELMAVYFATPGELRVDDDKDESNSRNKWQKYLAVDKKGNIISTREELIRRVKDRMRSGSPLPADCDREAVEKGKSVRGGFRINLDHTYEFAFQRKVTDVYLDLLVPADPEFQEEAKKTLALPKGKSSAPFLYKYNRELVPAILRENYEERARCGSPTNLRGLNDGETNPKK